MKDGDDDDKAVKKKKKTKKKQAILYAEDATKLFKKINDGKRFKNGISLSKACNIFSVAWELPEENGRILPSKVVRHFKQVLPSKKAIKKKKVGKEEKRTSDTTKNIKPSLIKIIKTDHDVEESVLIKPQTMRGHVNVGAYLFSSSNQQGARRTINMIPNNAMTAGKENLTKKKKNPMSDLERMIASNKIKNNDDHDYDDGNKVIKRRKAESMYHLELNGFHFAHNDDKDQIVENEVEQIIEEKKKLKQKEQNVANAIDSALGI